MPLHQSLGRTCLNKNYSLMTVWKNRLCILTLCGISVHCLLQGAAFWTVIGATCVRAAAPKGVHSPAAQVPLHTGHLWFWPGDREDLHIFAGNLPTLHLLGILVQLPGHPGPKHALGQCVIHVQDVIFLKTQFRLHLCQTVIQGPGPWNRGHRVEETIPHTCLLSICLCCLQISGRKGFGVIPKRPLIYVTEQDRIIYFLSLMLSSSLLEKDFLCPVLSNRHFLSVCL